MRPTYEAAQANNETNPQAAASESMPVGTEFSGEYGVTGGR